MSCVTSRTIIVTSYSWILVQGVVVHYILLLWFTIYSKWKKKNVINLRIYCEVHSVNAKSLLLLMFVDYVTMLLVEYWRWFVEILLVVICLKLFSLNYFFNDDEKNCLSILHNVVKYLWRPGKQVMIETLWLYTYMVIYLYVNIMYDYDAA